MQVTKPADLEYYNLVINSCPTLLSASTLVYTKHQCNLFRIKYCVYDPLIDDMP